MRRTWSSGAGWTCSHSPPSGPTTGRRFPIAARPVGWSARSIGVGALVLFAAGCAGSGGGDAEIAEIRQTVDPRVLEVSVNTCNADLTPDITETSDDVTLSITQQNNAVGDDCQDSIRIELDQPLGDRTILLGDGSPFRPLPYPTPTPVADGTPSGPIAFCGRDDFEQPDPDLVDSDSDLGRYYEQVDLAYAVAQDYRSDPSWRGLSGRRDPIDGYVFVFRFTDVTPELEVDIGDRLVGVHFEIAAAEFTDDELAAAGTRLERQLTTAGLASVTGIVTGSNSAAPGRVVIHLIDPVDGVELPERIDLEAPYDPYCIWPNPSPNGPARD